MLGTPAFAPPEQIRGGSLDVRSDLYSTGATLYYLLTGQPPFTGDGIVQIVANVLDAARIRQARLKPDVPEPSARSCCAAWRRIRPNGPTAINACGGNCCRSARKRPRQQLQAARVTAAIVDIVFSGLPSLVGFALLNPRALATLSPGRDDRGFRCRVALLRVAGGNRGGFFGKMMFGIRVVGPGNRPAGIGRIVVRTLLYVSSSFVPLALLLLVPRARAHNGCRDDGTRCHLGAAPFIGFGLLFLTARRGNGFAGAHDLASRTRVVRRVDSSTREPLSIPRHTVEVTPEARHIGPYAILDTHTDQDINRVLLAYDQICVVTCGFT